MTGPADLPPVTVEEVLAALTRAFAVEERVISVAPDSAREDALVVAVQGSGEISVFPDRLQVTLNRLETAEARSAEIEEFVDRIVAFTDIDKSAHPPALEHIYPIIRPVEGPVPSGADLEPLSLAFAPGLSILFVEEQDTGNGSQMAYLMSTDLPQLGLSIDQLYERSLDNLHARPEPVQLEVFEAEDGATFYAVQLDDFLESSLMLRPAFWDKLRVDGQTLAFGIPDRNALLLMNCADSGQIGAFARIVQTFFEGAEQPISADIWHHDGADWSTLPVVSER